VLSVFVTLLRRQFTFNFDETLPHFKRFKILFALLYVEIN